MDNLLETISYVDCAHQYLKEEDHHANRKRLIICCDGTWNNSNRANCAPTNVSRLSAAVAHKCCTGMPQVVYYHRGAGTEESKTASIMGGLLGLGVKQDIVDCYRFICDNYNPGDELIIVGFSRGAFTARSIAAMVCTLGYLNRTGLGSLGDIYQDYQSFDEWREHKMYDPKKHLRAFTVERLENTLRRKFMDKMERKEKQLKEDPNRSEERKQQIEDAFAEVYKEYEHRLSPEALEKRVEKDRRELFERMTQVGMNDSIYDNAEEDEPTADLQMAKAYREQLCEYQMCLTKKSSMDAQTTYEAVEGSVKAVGVWDTVGSLGIPKMPWQTQGSASELRFASVDVHPNVDHAFHALALDESRTPFGPTLWNIKPDNHNTQLRQVWFPGCHSNVGGGSDTQQISKIAFAWMADQMSSVGVEFSKYEMKRIFRSYPTEVDARPWGLGKITSPGSFTTTFPDKAWNAATLPYRAVLKQWTETNTRKPGLYCDDKGEPLERTNEFIHPSVRVRYLYNGLGLDDGGEWQCKALSGHDWQLMFEKNTPREQDIRPGRDPMTSDQYKTITGTVTAVYEQYPKKYSPHETFVRAEQPTECDLKKLDPPKNTWSWKLRTEDRTVVLPEEQVGMWERMYIEINDDMVRWKDLTEKQKKEGEVLTRGDHTRERATRNVEYALSTVDRMLWNAIEKVFGAPPSKYLPKGYPEQHGYYDFVSWQRGLESNTPCLSKRISMGRSTFSVDSNDNSARNFGTEHGRKDEHSH